MSSDLHKRFILGDETDRGDLQRQVWAGTPWIVSAYSGGGADPVRDRDMLLWCHERFGQESWPFGDKPIPGRWKRGGATVFGWTWYGFSTEGEMQEFMAAWPDPPREQIIAEQGARFGEIDLAPQRIAKAGEP